jgi:hypothetical protein
MIVQQGRDGTSVSGFAGQRFEDSLLNIPWQVGPEPEQGSPQHGFDHVHAMPLGDEVSRDTEYHDTGQDQQGNRAGDAAVQTIAREMTAHGLNPLMRSLGVMVLGLDGSTRFAGAIAGSFVADVAEGRSGPAIGR